MQSWTRNSTTCFLLQASRSKGTDQPDSPAAVSVAKVASAWCISSAVGLGPARGLAFEVKGLCWPAGCFSLSLASTLAEFLAREVGSTRALAALPR